MLPFHQLTFPSSAKKMLSGVGILFSGPSGPATRRCSNVLGGTGLGLLDGFEALGSLKLDNCPEHKADVP